MTQGKPAGNTEELLPDHVRRHRGDIMSSEKRSVLMSRIRGKGTRPELAIKAALRPTRFRFECHSGDLPGKPDFVFRATRVAVFVDGDFWHGWKFNEWKDKLSPQWELKIGANRRRDDVNNALLAQGGWMVLRIWEHEIEDDVEACAARIIVAVRARGGGRREYQPNIASFSV